MERALLALGAFFLFTGGLGGARLATLLVALAWSLGQRRSKEVHRALEDLCHQIERSSSSQPSPRDRQSPLPVRLERAFQDLNEQRVRLEAKLEGIEADRRTQAQVLHRDFLRLGQDLEGMRQILQSSTKHLESARGAEQMQASLLSSQKEKLPQLGVQLFPLEERLDELLARVEPLRQGEQKLKEAAASLAGLAERTQVLALNAAIEASRVSGEESGFLVVSEEIRKLSVETQERSQRLEASLRERSRTLDRLVEGAEALRRPLVEVREISLDLERLQPRLDQTQRTASEVRQDLQAQFDELAFSLFQLEAVRERWPLEEASALPGSP